MRDRFRGCILGLAVGDAVGVPFEGIDGYGIHQSFGRAIDIVSDPPVPVLEYSDDTEMMLGVAEVLIDRGTIDADKLIHRFAENYNPGRGYGMGVKKILQAVRDGADGSKLADTQFPGGSFGNGAAMRVAPVGALFHTDLDRVEDEALRSAFVTHRHPIGIDGARIMAIAVALAMRGEAHDRVAFFDQLGNRAGTDDFRERIDTATTQGRNIAPSSLGHGVEAHRSVVTAILCFDQFHDSFTGTLASAIRAGGDVDTIAAMACALSGAALGFDAIPPHLTARLENGNRGRDYILHVADKLHDRYTSNT